MEKTKFREQVVSILTESQKRYGANYEVEKTAEEISKIIGEIWAQYTEKIKPKLPSSSDLEESDRNKYLSEVFATLQFQTLQLELILRIEKIFLQRRKEEVPNLRMYEETLQNPEFVVFCEILQEIGNAFSVVFGSDFFVNMAYPVTFAPLYLERLQKHLQS